MRLNGIQSSHPLVYNNRYLPVRLPMWGKVPKTAQTARFFGVSIRGCHVFLVLYHSESSCLFLRLVHSTILIPSLARMSLVPAFSQLDRKVELPVMVTVRPITWVQPSEVVELPLYWSAEAGV